MNQTTPMPAPASEAAVRRFGTTVFLLADTIFFAGLLYLLATRERFFDASPEDLLLILAASGCTLLGALWVRARASLFWAFFGCACALFCYASFVVRALDAGWTPWAGPQALAMYMLLGIWAIHLFVLMVVFGIARIRETAAPNATRILFLSSVVGFLAGAILFART